MLLRFRLALVWLPGIVLAALGFTAYHIGSVPPSTLLVFLVTGLVFAAIMAAVRHDYQRFADHELATRRAAQYPPFASMIRLIVRGAAEATARETANSLGERLRSSVASMDAAGLRVVGPGTAPIARLRGEFRFHLQIQGPDGALLRQAVREAAKSFTAPEGVRWIADVDPWDMQ